MFALMLGTIGFYWRLSDPIDVSTLRFGVYAITYVLDGEIRNSKLIIQRKIVLFF